MSSTEHIFLTDDLFTRSAQHSRCVVLNRIKQGQVMDTETLDFVTNAVHAYKTYNREIMSIMIRNTGNGSFCPGPDLKELEEALPRKEFYKKVQKLAYELLSATYPTTISIVNGIVGGCGLSMALNAKYVCGTPNTVVVLNDSFSGFVPHGGAAYHYARLPKFLGFYLALTGIPLAGLDAFLAGILTHMAPEHHYDNVIETLETAEYKGLQAVSHAVSDNLEVTMTITPEMRESFVLQDQVKTIRRCFSAPTLEGILEKLAREETAWADETAEAIKKGSPTAQKVTLKMLQDARFMSLEACLQMEQRAMLGMFETKDYQTGYQAALQDSKVSPDQWEPRQLADVSDNDVAKILAAPEDDKDDFVAGVLIEDIAGGELVTHERATVSGLPLEQVPWLQDGHEAAKIEPYSKEYLESIGLVYPSTSDQKLNSVSKRNDLEVTMIPAGFMKQQEPAADEDSGAVAVEVADDDIVEEEAPVEDVAIDEVSPLEEAAEDADMK
eukprot:CAMPEP_0167778562 /NCGR_PEP_ID=MMETSP0111_2-20121227/4322_1 /TAXON_ID=91324 /ORGANISM="Lotharella globosa, Strain CCCM811" /LENGTH=497 /DNA_ID=CAMNT_0007668879 /DNA_START=80 /DNA_END=1573 /DNA_ORIENTATION=+